MSSHPHDTVEGDSEGPDPVGSQGADRAGDGGPERVALVSDVHANLPAFRAVLDDIESEGIEDIWCLGDLVGYGAQPDDCVALAAETCSVCLIGNHDLAVIGELDVRDFSGLAAAAVEWTRARIGDASIEYLSALEPVDTSPPVGLFHASPRDPVWEYVLSIPQADDCIEAMEPRVGAIGHSHVALCFWREDGAATTGRQAPDGAVAEMRGGRWLINPGGVGQPRDGDPRAAWLVLDLGAMTATWRRVEYPIEEAADAIRAAGLPGALSDRLFQGQ